MTTNNKHEIAKLLYTANNLPQTDIITKLDISQQQLNTWANEGCWDKLRDVLASTKDEQLRILYRQLTNLNKSIMDGAGFPSDKEANTQKRLATSIKHIESETSIGSTVMVAKEFTNWLLQEDEKLAKTIILYFETYIKNKLKFDS